MCVKSVSRTRGSNAAGSSSKRSNCHYRLAVWLALSSIILQKAYSRMGSDFRCRWPTTLELPGYHVIYIVASAFPSSEALPMNIKERCSLVVI